MSEPRIIRLEDNPIFRERQLQREITDVLKNADRVNQAAEQAIEETLRMLRKYETPHQDYCKNTS